MHVNAPNQVNIRVRVAEVSRSIEKQLGFNWDTAFKFGNFALGLAFGNVGAVSNGIGAITGSFNSNKVSATALIDALASNGLITILAEPNLSAVSGEPASFLAGGEFPFPVPQSNNTTTIDFKKFGVSLNFVATIADNERINLHISPEVSEISTANQVTLCPGSSSTTSSCFVVPSLTSRRAETTIELGSGESFAIGGLLQNDITQNLNKFPWLGDLPVLGTLFRSNDFKRNESELVIIVTPYIVRPTASASRLAAPTDGFTPSSDASQVFNGATYRPQYQKQGAAPASRTGTGLIGPAGFDLD
jgi:pilus assembly protein CpaC